MRLHFMPPAGTVRAVASAVVCAVAFPALAIAQGPPLAEVARKEAERRKGVTQAPKVITTKDLPESARKPATGSPTPTASATNAGEPAPQSGEQKAAPAAAAAAANDAGQRDEKYWRSRLTQAQETLRRNEMFAEALQTRINALTTNFVNHNDPHQRATVGADRVKALAELERVKNDVEQGRKQIADIEEEARKAGVPSGWLR